MQCPFCRRGNGKVVDSRSSEGGQSVRRRRQCVVCERRFTTYERSEETIPLTVIKKDGSRQRYERRKIIEGLQKSCNKLPVTDEEILAIVDATEEAILDKFDKDVPSSFIGDAVSEHLRKVNKIAYVRFASVYRQFQDVGELISEAREVEEAPPLSSQQKGLFEERDESDAAGDEN